MVNGDAGRGRMVGRDALADDLAAVLADVLGTGDVDHDADFFADLDADSLLLAQFCARLHRRDDLPSPSIKEVYQHPTIAALAAQLGGPPNTRERPEPVAEPIRDLGGVRLGSPLDRPSRRVSTSGYLLCGVLQLMVLAASALLSGVVLAAGYEWVAAASGPVDTYLRAAGSAAATFVGLSLAPIAVKWALVGTWIPGRIRLWSVDYVRFWVVRIAIASSPVRVFAGTPLYSLYLRALGADIGRGAVILSANVPVCTDLLRVGPGAVVRSRSSFSCYRAHDGHIETGPVVIGRGAFVGEATVLDIDTEVGDGAQVGHSSALHRGQRIPAGERRVGTPATQPTDVDHRAVAPTARTRRRRITYSALQLAVLFLITLPVAGSLLSWVLESRITDATATAAAPSATDGAFLVDALVIALVLFGVATVARLAFAITVPGLLGLAIRPGVTYPLYGLRYWALRGIARFGNVRFFTNLFGDTAFIVHYLYLLGYDVAFEGQTGANFGLNVTQDVPSAVSVGAGTMAADGLAIVNTTYSSSSFRVDRVRIGSQCFLGNNIVYPAQATTGDNCLLASKVMVPLDGERREDVGQLGSPPFEIPRTVERDRRFGELRDGPLHRALLRAKTRHNLASIGWFLLSRFVALYGAVLFVLAGADLYPNAGVAAFALAPVAVLVVGSLYYVLVERLSVGFRRLTPMSCSIYDEAAWRIERFWKLSWQPGFLNGTPFKPVLWRLLGVRVGRRLYDDGCIMVEKTMITIGDDCVLNAGSVIQPHSQEDGAFKSDDVVIGSRCSLGVGALVHYGVTMDDGSSADVNAFVMKGSHLPAGSRWGENPARQLDPGGPCGWGVAADEDGAEAADRHWRGVLAGGVATVPRWTATPGAGRSRCGVVLDGELVDSLHRVAGELDVDVPTLLFAAHARVVAAMTGEQRILAGYVTVDEPGAAPLPVSVVASGPSWRALVRAVDAATRAAVRHRPHDLGLLLEELGLDDPPYETLVDPTGRAVELGERVLLALVAAEHDGRPLLALAHRTDAFDDAAAARILGYHVRALSHLVDDVDADLDHQTVVGSDEHRFQIEGLAGPRRELPDRRFHELFADRACRHPDAIAAVSADGAWSYRELDERSNRLGRALLAAGLQPEDVVAVVTERNLDWMAAVIGVFKAGGVYLPIEPHFPPDRIAATLRRSGCELVVTEHGSTTTLDVALAEIGGARVLDVADIWAADHSPTDLGVAVGADQLAYIYFTSGSTGEPKGAMCEHAGFVNHLYAKIDDLEIDEGEVVAQIAPQCFDISLWQLVSALLVGGTTLIIDQDTILDPAGFLDTLVRARVGVIQVVPSYLEVLLSYLERHPRPLPSLHCVSATGEALKLELVRRWFRSQPSIALVNAYGLTETSDDTNHEVLREAPRDGVVPLGPAVNNVHVYVVDEQLRPVPLGAPGEIVFSGVCVGRGYINDPDRTRAAYLDDPHRTGERLYRSGDFGRWRPDGKLEYLGRRDAQVKIRGFRIEIGEIENAMLRVPGVRGAAVVIHERPGGDRQLVGFYEAEGVEVDQLRADIARSLPDYMVPSTIHRRARLPLTGNGKVDRTTLTALAGEVETTTEVAAEAPATPTERRIAAAWADVLGVPASTISRADDFFDLGGTSLSAVEAVIGLGGAASLKDLTRHPVLADLGAVLDGAALAPAAMLQRLGGSGPCTEQLVCFPHAGGNAVNFHAMARALSGSGVEVLAVELPGHDPTAPDESFASLDTVVDAVVAEVVDLGARRVSLWGHSSGAAYAVEAARRLEQGGHDLGCVFIGAQLPGTAGTRLAHLAALDERSDEDIAGELVAGGGFAELSELGPDRGAHIGAAYRHDCVAAHRYLIAMMEAPPVERLHAPLMLVAAADDPATEGWQDRVAEWHLVAERVEAVALDGGGHYFLRTRPEQVADVVRRTVGRPEGEPVRAFRPASDVPDAGAPESALDATGSPVDAGAAAVIALVRGGSEAIASRPTVTFDGTAACDATSWLREQRDEIRRAVVECGAVRVRGLDLADADAVAAVAAVVTDRPVVDREAFAARDEHAAGVYSSSAWPANQQMCLHHELSYRLEVPAMMLFACLDEPARGGAIALADATVMPSILPGELVDRFARDGWILTRTYGDDIGLSAEEAFGVDDRRAIERYCRANAIATDWRPDGTLRTWQRRRALVHHPVTGRRCWFNQIAFLSEWTMKPEVREFLVDLRGPDGLPFTTRHGTGEPIGEDWIAAINDAYDSITVTEPLVVGDLLVIDNIATAHGREPYEGPREVVVVMADPVRVAGP